MTTKISFHRPFGSLSRDTEAQRVFFIFLIPGDTGIEKEKPLSAFSASLR